MEQTQEDGLLQKLIAFQAENDDEFDIQMRVELTHDADSCHDRVYQDDLKEILQAALNSQSAIRVKTSDKIVMSFTVTPLYQKTRDYIRDPFHGPREPHDMHFNEDRIYDHH